MSMNFSRPLPDAATGVRRAARSKSRFGGGSGGGQQPGSNSRSIGPGRAYARAFGRAPVLIHSGGSIPAVSEFQRVLGIPTILMGFASPSDGLHGPNEKFSIQSFHRGIVTSRAFLRELARALPWRSTRATKPPAAFS